MKILVAIPDTPLRRLFFPQSSEKRLERIGQVKWNPFSHQFPRDELEKELSSVDACITGWHTEKITPDLIDGSRLRSISHVGGSVTEIVSEEIFSLPLLVTNANDAFGTTVAEFALMLLLMAFRKISEFTVAMTNTEGYWIAPDTCLRELSGKTIGILGYGAISRELIRFLRPFRTEILLFSRHCSPEIADREGFSLREFEEVISRSDAIVPLSTLTSDTYHLIDANALSNMRDDAVIVNTGRGALIDEVAMIGELKKGRLYAALDVYEREPLPDSSELRSLPNVICAPHMGGKTLACRERMGTMVLEDVERIASNQEPENVVSLELYRRMSQKVK